MKEMSKEMKNVGRRRSRSLVGCASKDLTETIPLSLPPDERLDMLLQLSFRHALSSVQKEFIGRENFNVDRVHQHGTECWQKIKTLIEENNLVQSAVAENADLQDSLLDHSNAATCNKAIAEFQAESKDWSNQISKYREALVKTMNSPYLTDASKWADHYNKLYNYTDVINSASTIQETMSQKTAMLSATTVSFKEILELSESLQDNIAKRCDKYFSKEVSNTPRTLIKKMAITRKNIKPYSIV